MLRTLSLFALFLSLFSVKGVKASSYQEVVERMGWNFTVSRGETEVRNLRNWTYVSKILVQADGIRGDGTVEVYANGQNVGTIYAPGRDPSYTVTIKETINSLEFRHVSGAPVRIRDITVYGKTLRTNLPRCSRGCGRTGGHLPATVGYYPTGVAADLALQAIQIVETLDYNTRWEDYGRFLLPIKKHAARAYAAAQARGDLSTETRETLLALAAQIDCAHEFIDAELSRDSVFYVMIDLMSLKSQILTLTQ